MPLTDVGERLQRASEVIARRQQRLGDVGARARSDGDAAPARALVDQPSRARRAFAVDDYLRDVVAQLDRQIETGVNRQIGAEVEGRPADFPSLDIERPYRAGRRSAR